MIHSQEFQDLTIADQYFKLAHGFLEGSKELCDAMLKGDYTPDYPQTRVILHLCRQAIELFIKGAVYCDQTNQTIEGHNLKTLNDEYKKKFPEPQFQFEIPFGFENTETPKLCKKIQKIITEKIRYFYATLDQSHRYPTDNKGNSFSNPEGFIPTMFASTIEKLAKDFSRIELEIKKKGP
jgi:hypothetical protein